MSSVEDILKKLKRKVRPDQLEGMTRYGIAVEKRLGISIPELRLLAKEIGKNHRLSLELWKKGIDEARILAAMIDDPRELSELEATRNVIVHNAGIIDDVFCKRVGANITCLGQKLELSNRKVAEFGNTVMNAGTLIIQAVSADITNAKVDIQ